MPETHRMRPPYATRHIQRTRMAVEKMLDKGKWLAANIVRSTNYMIPRRRLLLGWAPFKRATFFEARGVISAARKLCAP